MSGERQVNVKSQSELDIGGRETYLSFTSIKRRKAQYKFGVQILREKNG